MAVELKRYKARIADANRETELAKNQAEIQESKFSCLSRVWQQVCATLQLVVKLGLWPTASPNSSWMQISKRY